MIGLVQLLAGPVALGEAGGQQRVPSHGSSLPAPEELQGSLPLPPPCSRDLSNLSHLCPQTMVNLRYQEC